MVAIPACPYPVDARVYDLLGAPLTVAHHEAGHCIVARALSLEVTKLTLECCRTVVALAGPTAERRFTAYPVGVALRLRSSAWKVDYGQRPTLAPIGWRRLSIAGWRVWNWLTSAGSRMVGDVPLERFIAAQVQFQRWWVKRLGCGRVTASAVR
jgi:hypothetical protein